MLESRRSLSPGRAFMPPIRTTAGKIEINKKNRQVKIGCIDIKRFRYHLFKL